MFYDLLVHVDLPDESRFVMALGNINNYLAALNGEPCTVVLLANGGAASFLARKDNAQTEAIEKLAQAGVSFRVCANAMKKVPITKEDLLPCVEVVPAGVVETFGGGLPFYEGDMKKHIIIGTLFALVLLASVARASETVERTDLADIFQGVDGTFIMYDEGADRYTVFNKALSETRLPPCSTFKVFHALIGLDSGVLDRDDARTHMKWNGKPSSIAAWNHDQTLASAMRHSVVWYFQRVAAGIGEERMQRGLDRIGYGNRDISGGLTRFWLQSSLKISPREQVGLLRALFNGSLPFAAEDIAVVKRDITLSSGKGLRFMGKTGSGSDDADRGIIGWFVGGVETPHNRWSFAVNIQGPDASGVRARGIAEAALKRLSILP